MPLSYPPYLTVIGTVLLAPFRCFISPAEFATAAASIIPKGDIKSSNARVYRYANAVYRPYRRHPRAT